MIRNRTYRKLATLATAAMFALASLGASAGGALASNLLFVGSGTVNQVLTLTPASTGQLTAMPLRVQNTSGQALTRVTTNGAPSALVNLTFDSVFGPDAAACAASSASAGLACDWGNLAAGATREVLVVFQVGAGSTSSVTVTSNFNEKKINPSTPDRADLEASTGSVGALFTTSADAIGTFVRPNQTRAVATGIGANAQSAAISIPGSNPNGDVVIIEEGVGGPFCPASRCFGAPTSFTINDGASIAPYVQVTFFWAASVLPSGFNAKFAGVVHYDLDDDGNVIPGSVVSLGTGAGDSCSATKTVNCVVSWSHDKKVGFTMVVRWPENGYGKGFG